MMKHTFNKTRISTPKCCYVLLMEVGGGVVHKQLSDGFRGREENTETWERAESLKRIRCSPGRPWGKGS